MCPNWDELDSVPKFCHDIRLVELHGYQVFRQDVTHSYREGENNIFMIIINVFFICSQLKVEP